MNELRFALFGTGFWARPQLAAWRELSGVRCVALYNRTLQKAQALGQLFGIPAVYDDPQKLLDSEQLDFIDVVTSVETHRPFVELAATHGLPVICQKPLAATLEDAEGMLARCRASGVPLLVHENWRWQRPIRAFKAALDTGVVGTLFHARVTYANSFPVFANQPFLKNLDQFILTDIGTHVLDTIRMLFGEVSTVYCRTARVHSDIRGEDVANLLLGMESGLTVSCEMSYASRLENERFPETYIVAEGALGSVELAPDYWIRTTTETGTIAQRVPPPRYAWADPAYDLVQASGVACNANLLGALQGRTPAETTGEDNLKSLRLVFAAYESATRGEVVRLSGSGVVNR